MKTHTLPKGFLASGMHCGEKKKRKDLSLLYSEKPCTASALFTKNVVKAAPVVLAQKQLKKSARISAVLVNSGNANCMTGSRGMRDAQKMMDLAAKSLDIPKDSVIVSSTGVIGVFMTLKNIISGIPKLVKKLSKHGLNDASDGIMTTDRFRKISSRTFTLGGKKIKMTGIAKGAGMIEPDMATMLCYIMTDANISKAALKKALKASTDTSFNAITVDGDMSTNDTVLVLANGEAKNKIIKSVDKGFKVFQKNLDEMTIELAKMIVADGEGASKVIEVRVRGAKTNADAKRVAEAVADSLLVKCAVLGMDPNWGRIASSAGSSGVKFNPEKIDIIIDGVTFLKKGKALAPKASKVKTVFKKKEAHIEVNLNIGKREAVFFSCDISKEYITLNSKYTT